MILDSIWTGAPQGWQCPICGAVYSPQTPACWYCNGQKTITNASNLEIKVGDWNLPEPEAVPLPYKVEAEPTMKLDKVIAPIKEKIEELKGNNNEELDTNTRIRKEGYDLAIDDVIDLINMETEDKTIVIEITNPFCGGARCASCGKRETCEKKEK